MQKLYVATDPLRQKDWQMTKRNKAVIHNKAIMKLFKELNMHLITASLPSFILYKSGRDFCHHIQAAVTKSTQNHIIRLDP